MLPDVLMAPLLRLWLHGKALRDDRGDVPGWVLITVMSALLMVALLAVARTRLVDILEEAFKSVEQQQG